MANANTKLYASQGNGGKATVKLSDITAGLSTASTTTAGTVKQSADVAALTSVGPGTPAAGLVDVTNAFSQTVLNANFATLGTEVNAILAALKAAGIMA